MAVSTVPRMVDLVTQPLSSQPWSRQPRALTQVPLKTISETEAAQANSRRLLKVRTNSKNILKKDLVGSESVLQAIVEACASHVAVLDESGNFLFASRSWYLSAAHSHLLSGQKPLFLKCLERENKRGNTSHEGAIPLGEDVRQILQNTVSEIHNDYLWHDSGGRRSFKVDVTRLKVPEAAGLFRVLLRVDEMISVRQTEDTLRALSIRLINAQEEERRRIARELHDDLNQRMALLAIELEQLAQRIPKEQSEIRMTIQGVKARAQEISSEIHEFHISSTLQKLDHLPGTVCSSTKYCEELSAHHIEIGFLDYECGATFKKCDSLPLQNHSGIASERNQTQRRPRGQGGPFRKQSSGPSLRIGLW